MAEMKMEIDVKNLDVFEYVSFVAQCLLDQYEVDLNDDFGINDQYREKFGKEPPEGLK